jgi:hypothetical protein
MNEFFTGVYDAIPERMRTPMVEYVRNRKRPGDFLTAVICNDLKGAIGNADKENSELLRLYVMWFYNIAPADCQGSKEKMNTWLNGDS